MEELAGNPRVIDLRETAALLALSEDGVRALARAGYLAPVAEEPSRFALGDVKALLARLETNQESDLFSEDAFAVDPSDLIDALDGKSTDMAERAFDVLQQALPEAAAWTPAERKRFVDDAKLRFEAILAITEHGEDRELMDELREVGAAASWAGSPLPELLLTLRISRDLVVQTAVEIAEERGRRWGFALALVLTRVLPAVDRMADAIAQGYWLAVASEQEEVRARHESVMEATSDGVYELDLDGRIQYANPSFAVLVGRRVEDLEGAALADVLVPADPSASIDVLTDTASPRRVALSIVRSDGVRRKIEILAQPRRRGSEIAGFQGVTRDLTAAVELEGQKDEFLALITHDLRQPLATVLGWGATLQAYGDRLEPERVRAIGGSVHGQAERIARLADDLYDISRIAGPSLLLASRAVVLEPAIASGLFSVDGGAAVELDVPGRLEVQADPRRLEQVVANLVENAIAHGAAPVRVEARQIGDAVEVSVSDGGDGVPSAVVPTLFSPVRTIGRADRDRSRGNGLGLSLVRDLVEAMGGRAWYDEDAPRTTFRFTLPTPRRH
jgi:PAS domain S-box-containing protein